MWPDYTASNFSNMLNNMYAYFFRKNPIYPVSKYRPNNETNKQSKYYSIPNLKYDVARNLSKDPITLKQLNSFDDVYQAHRGGRSRQMDSVNMGLYKVDTGQDQRGRYISFWDKYDWNLLEQLGLNGMPFEIYDRIYEDEWPVYKNNVDTVTGPRLKPPKR